MGTRGATWGTPDAVLADAARTGAAPRRTDGHDAVPSPRRLGRPRRASVAEAVVPDPAVFPGDRVRPAGHRGGGAGDHRLPHDDADRPAGGGRHRVREHRTPTVAR